VDTLTIDPTGAHDLQHSRWTHLQLIPHGLMIYNTRGGHTYNRPHRGSQSTTLEMDTLTIDPTGAQFHHLQHSRCTHLQLTPQGSRSTTLEVDTLTLDPKGAHDLQHSKWKYLQLTPHGLNSTTYNTRGGHTIDPTGAQFHDLQHSRWTHLQLTQQGLTIYNTRGGHTYNRPHRGPIPRPTTLGML
jgi:hypothetical protein